MILFNLPCAFKARGDLPRETLRRQVIRDPVGHFILGVIGQDIASPTQDDPVVTGRAIADVFLTLLEGGGLAPQRVAIQEARYKEARYECEVKGSSADPNQPGAACSHRLTPRVLGTT